MSAIAAHIRAGSIIQRAAALMDIDEVDITSDDREPLLCEIRWAIMQVMRDEGFSYPQIGRALLRDHGTVVHGVKRSKALMGCSYYAGFVEALR